MQRGRVLPGAKDAMVRLLRGAERDAPFREHSLQLPLASSRLVVAAKLGDFLPDGPVRLGCDLVRVSQSRDLVLVLDDADFTDDFFQEREVCAENERVAGGGILCFRARGVEVRGRGLQR